MLQTLPLVLYILMVEVSIGSMSVLVFLDWRNEAKRGFLVSYAFIYLFLTGLTYLFQQNFASQSLLDSYTQLDKAWTGAQALPLLLFFLLMIPYTLFLLLDKSAGIDGKVEREKAVAQGDAAPRGSVVRLLRLISGVATVVAGLVTLFVLAMIFRPLAAANLGGVFTVASFFAAAFALGGVMTAMWLGHWYLVTPALSEKPLLFATTIVLVAVFAQIIFSLAIGPNTAYVNKPSTAVSTPISQTTPAPTFTATKQQGGQVKPEGTPVVTPLSSNAINWIRILVSFVMPLILGGLAWKLVRDRSFQSATGMLYLVVVCTLAGEAMARGLFLLGLS
jgi:DMSO reductase anchor subunit